MGLFYFVFFIFWATTTSLWPTTVKQFSLKSLTETAVTVAWVHCDNTTPALIDGELYTNYEFTVIETIKGLQTPKIRLSLPGGNFQGRRYQIVGMPIFSTGTYELLFLTHAAPKRSAWPIGLYQGAARIIRDKNGVDYVFFRQKPHVTKTLIPSKLTVMGQNKKYDGTPLSNVLTHIRSLMSDQSNEY